jgi:ligand-binding SRPBCC domain-containing protein
MRVHVLHREQLLPHPVAAVFPFFGDAGNLEAITPPLLSFRIVAQEPLVMAAGTRLEYRLRVHGIPVSWRTLIAEWSPPHRFVDMQTSGPYAIWHHTHEFREAGEGRTLMTDTVRYAIAYGVFGELARRLVVRRDLERIFDHRAAAILPLLRR